MANVCLDITPLRKIVNKEGWYDRVREDVESGRMKVFIGHGKFKDEIRVIEKVKIWINEMARQGKVKSVDEDEFNQLFEFLESHHTSNFQECDDQHIFAVAKLAKVKFVLTEDARLARCRERMRASHDCRDCCKFKIISCDKRFNKHRQAMIAAG